MSEKQIQLTAILEITQEIYAKANAVQEKMEDNEPEQIEALQQLAEKREKVIKQLDDVMKEPGFQWSIDDKVIIQELKELNSKLEPLMNRLYQSFQKQIQRMNQSKHISSKYAVNPVGIMDGAYIDKRK